MSEIHVNRDGSSLGIFGADQVLSGLRTGQFKNTDFGWRDGMAEWKALGDWPEFKEAAASSSVSATSPAANFAGAAATAAAAAVTIPPMPEGDGPPWENRSTLGMGPALIQTIKAVLLEPTTTFASMKKTGGFGGPVFYAVLLSTIGVEISLAFQLVMQLIATGASAGGGAQDAAIAGIGGSIGIAIFMVLSPLIILIGLFVWSGILHLSLMIVGGANSSFETTLRTIAYATGSANLLQAVPVCGGIISGVWGLVVTIIGISKTHSVSVGKAVLAILLPLMVVCVLGVGVAIMIPAILAASQR